jgi:predicted histidine transporter YuiF (NhaC family)
MFSVAQDKPLSRALFGPGATLNKKLAFHHLQSSKVPTFWAENIRNI